MWRKWRAPRARAVNARNPEEADMQTRTITIAPAGGTWVVRVAGAVIGETTEALELHEDGYPPVIYFPREDIEMAFLDPSERRTTSPLKGEATYYSVIAKSGPIEDCAWSYENPEEDVARIRGYIAFYPGEKVTVERI